MKIYLLYIRKISTMNTMKKTSKSETLTTLILMMIQKTTDCILCLPKVGNSLKKGFKKLNILVLKKR